MHLKNQIKKIIPLQDAQDAQLLLDYILNESDIALSRFSAIRGEFLDNLNNIEDQLEELFYISRNKNRIKDFIKFFNTVLDNSNAARFRTYEECISKTITFLLKKHPRLTVGKGFDKFNDYLETKILKQKHDDMLNEILENE